MQGQCWHCSLGTFIVENHTLLSMHHNTRLMTQHRRQMGVESAATYWAAIMMTKAVASSAEKPLVGVSLASFTPMARVTL